MLTELTEEDRMNLVDCLNARTFEDGDVIIKQGVIIKQAETMQSGRFLELWSISGHKW